MWKQDSDSKELNNDALGCEKREANSGNRLDKVGTLRALGRVVSIRRPERKRPCLSSKEREGFPGLGDNIRK